MKSRSRSALIAAALLLAAGSAAGFNVSRLPQWHGHHVALADACEGYCSLRFTAYPSEHEPSAIAPAEVQHAISVRAGSFTALLPRVDAAEAYPELWIEIAYWQHGRFVALPGRIRIDPLASLIAADVRADFESLGLDLTRDESLVVAAASR
jgi:hypothetical protein